MIHNLNIESYTLDELFQLFDLDHQLTEEKMKNAKKKVLMIHPDKSKLDPKYFVFYKKAYEMVLNIYKEQCRHIEGGSKNMVVGNQRESIGEPDKYVSKQIQETIETMGQNKFQEEFNRLYEEKATKRIDEKKFNWFREANEYNVDGQVNSKNMGHMIEQVRKKQSNELIQYQGVQDFRYFGKGSNYFDDDDDNSNSYVECDPFSKLKFDDLRKVHKDQTVLTVSDSDYRGQRYKNVQEYQMAREQETNALSEIESKKILEEKRRQEQIEIMKKQYRDQISRSQNEQMQEQVRGTFLRLEK